MSIFEFTDYKAYIRENLKKKPKKGHGEMLRLAEALSIHSTLVSQILKGSKNFTLEQAQGAAEYLGLIGLEADYFMNLVQLERAGTSKLKSYFKSQLEKQKAESLKLVKRVVRDHELTDEEKARFYSDWQYSAIRLLTSIPQYKTKDRLSEYLNLPATKVAEMLQFLVACGLCVEIDGVYDLGVQRTHLSDDSPFIKQHRLNWRVKALERLSHLSAEELMFVCPCSIREKDFAEFREELVELIKRFYERIKEPEAELLACLNIDWFFI